MSPGGRSSLLESHAVHANVASLSKQPVARGYTCVIAECPEGPGEPGWSWKGFREPTVADIVLSVLPVGLTLGEEWTTSSRNAASDPVEGADVLRNTREF